MSQVLLLHSAMGLRPAVRRLADELVALGHELVVPDYYEGQVFDDGRAGTEHRDAVGAGTLFQRVQAHLTAHELRPDAVLAGLSLGAAFAQALARHRPQAHAVVLLHHVTAPRGAWSGQPVQVHRYAEDPWVEPDDVDLLGQAVRQSGARFEDHVTPGRGHLFTDLDLPDGDAEATARTVTRIHEFLGLSAGA